MGRLWIKRVAAGLIILVLLLTTLTYAAGAIARTKLASRNPEPGRLIDVNGYQMHLYCIGEGSPTVILVAGLDDFSIAWSWVQPEIARETRVCSYDRAGLGWSEARPDARTSANMVRELHALLAEAGIEGPYVIAGHSFGGALAQLYVHNYPGEVVGLVLVDAAPLDLFNRVPAWGKAIEGKVRMYRTLARLESFGLLALIPGNIPNRGFPERALAQYRAVSVATNYYEICITENELFESNLSEIKSANITGFGDLPVVILSRGTWDAMPGLSQAENRQAEQEWQKMQSELRRLSSNSRQIIAEESEHNIELDQPSLVVAAILEVVRDVR